MPEALENEIRTLRAHFWSERDPEGRAFVPLADAYLRKGDLDEAQALLEDGLGRHPDFASGHLVSARVHRARDDAAGLREAVERLLQLDASNAAGLRLKGEILEGEGEFDEALRCFRRALDLNPEYDDLEARVGRLELQLSDDGEPGRDEGRDDFVTSADVYSEGLDEARRGAMDEFESPDPDEASSSAAEAAAPSVDTGEEAFDLGWGQEFEDSDVEMSDQDIDDHEGQELTGLAADLDPDEFDGLAADLDPDDFDDLTGRDELPDEPSDEFPDEPSERGSAESTEGERMEDLYAFPDTERDSERGSPVPEAAGRSPGTGVSAMSDADREVVLEGEPEGELLMSESAPESRPGAEESDEPDESSPADRGPDSPTITRTLGELYLRQGLTERAAEIFEELVRRQPEAKELQDRLEFVRERLEADASAAGTESRPDPDATDEDLTDHPEDRAPQWTESEGDDAEESVSPFAWGEAESEEGSGPATREAAVPVSPDGPTISTYLDDLLAWEPGAMPIEALDPAAVPIESLAPRPGPGGETSGPGDQPAEGSLDDFQDWLRGLRP